MSTELDPGAFKSGQPGQYTWFLTESWTDYDGVNAYRDRGLGTETGFEPGIGRIRDLHDDPKGEYYFGDHLGTVRGVGMISNVFTAFGEPRVANLDGGDNRYGYVGMHGYQAHDEIPFLHVGARYYDPSIGRFLQRDPIGIYGDPNVYVYADNNPLYYIDPDGLSKHTGQALLQAMGRGKVKEVETILDCAGELLKPAMREAAKKWLQKMRTPASKWIAKNKKGDIWRRFPSELKDRTLEQINELARKGNKSAKTAWKLLNDKRFDKISG